MLPPAMDDEPPSSLSVSCNPPTDSMGPKTSSDPSPSLRNENPYPPDANDSDSESSSFVHLSGPFPIDPQVLKASSSSSSLSLQWAELEFSILERFAQGTIFSKGIDRLVGSLTNLEESVKHSFDPKRVELAHLAHDQFKSRSPQNNISSAIWETGLEAYTPLGAFEVLSTDSTPPPIHLRPRLPLGSQEWVSLFDEYVPDPIDAWQITRGSFAGKNHQRRDISPDKGLRGRLMKDEAWLRKRVFFGGIDKDLRPQIWLFLLGVYPMQSTASERQRIREEAIVKYVKDKMHWKRQALEKRSSDPKSLEELIHAVDKDVIRTDRNLEFYQPFPRDSDPDTWSENMLKLRDLLVTFAWSHNRQLGYVQGMADLASLLLVVNGGQEVAAYKAFVALMDGLGDNFRHDGRGMKYHLETLWSVLETLDPGLAAHLEALEACHLFFVFRWILVCFRREFDFGSICLLWDALLSRHETPDWIIYMAAGILLDHRESLVKHLVTFDEIFQYAQDLSMRLSPTETIVNGYVTWKQFTREQTLKSEAQTLEDPRCDLFS